MDVTSRTYPFRREQPFVMPEEFGWLREHAPVSRVTLASGDPAWLVTRHADVRAALTDPRLGRNLNRAGAARMDTGFAADRSSPVFGFGSSISEPPGHTRWRRLVTKVFTQRQADAMRPAIAAHADEVLDALAERGAPADLMADFAYQLPIRVICDLLGLAHEERPEFTALAARLTRRDLQEPGSPAAFGEALQAIGRYGVGLIVRKRRELGDDLLSTLIAVHDEDDSRLSNEELVATLVLLLMAGYESTAVQFGNAFYALFLHPDQRHRLAADPRLTDTAVEEILRWAQLGTGFAVAKYATTDIELGGVEIPAGSTVFVSLGSANRDAAVFGDDAELFDVGRVDARRHLAFSAGAHYCLGAALARAELAEGISRLLARFPAIRPAAPLSDVVLASNLFPFYPRELPVTW